MFVAREISSSRGKIVYKVLESYREGGTVKQHHIISLAYHRTVQAAYRAALKDYLKASDKLERLESVMSCMQGKGA